MAKRNSARYFEVSTLYLSGFSSTEIAKKFGCSGQNIRQMLKRMGLGSSVGGPWVKAKERAKERAAEVEARRLARWGLTKNELEQIAPNGTAHPDSPMRVFWYKKRNADRFGVSWELSFAEWWKIWQDSGRWNERGRGKYVMGRLKNDGPFSVENTVIMSQSEASKRSFILKPAKYRAELASARRSANVQQQS